MPSMMIHMLTAYKLCPDAEALFYIGTIAPDAVQTREEKDITHFRTHENRDEALAELARKTDKENVFDEGVLLHLFLDRWWDEKSFCCFTDFYKGEDWFAVYRKEIALASSYIFHNNDWSDAVWQEILSCPKEKYGRAPAVSNDELEYFLNRNYKWHKENNIGPSAVYPPVFVEDFINEAVVGYTKWRNI